jgi:hypothetical protein
MLINKAARSTLLAPGGAFDALFSCGLQGCMEQMKATWKDYKFENVYEPNDSNIRGWDTDHKIYKTYPYLTIAKQYWSIILKYVT